MATSKFKARSVKWFGWKPDLPDHRDHVFDQSWLKQVAAPPSNHLLPAQFIPAVRDQGQQGSCTGHMAMGVAEYVHMFCGQPLEEASLSPAFAYFNARGYEGTTSEDSGAEIRDAFKGIIEFGISTKKLCPYSAKRWATKPSATAYKNALTEMITEYGRIPDGSLDQVKLAIANDFPVGFGFVCYSNMESDAFLKEGLLSLPQGSVDGGHAVWVCGYDDTKVIDGRPGAVLCFNSWGTDVGCQPDGYKSRGLFWMPYKYIANRNLADDFWVARRSI